MSANQELHPPPKPRVSPLDVRNTDLVSRLLAATPPYLYNMPLVPNSYFFSEMLRSLVQAKSEASAKMATSSTTHNRRPRKRSWTQTRSDYYHKLSPKTEKYDPHMSWSPKFTTTEREALEKMSDKPLQLTVNKTIPETASQESKINTGRLDLPTSTDMEANIKQDMPNPNASLMYPTVPSELNHVPSPSMWYPSLYPPPYGMDPLHFFIDLRVSDHIYDKKNHPSSASSSSPKMPAPCEKQPPQETQTHFQNLHSICGGLRQTRHSSAFSVPVATTTEHNAGGSKQKTLKFDVKSMGFDKTYNKTSTRYIMSNIGNIYKTMQNQVVPKFEADEAIADQADSSKSEAGEVKETEEEKQKRVKDLRALIGLELVVDYMNHAKPGQVTESLEESIADTESSTSSAIEVISVEDNSKDVITY